MESCSYITTSNNKKPISCPSYLYQHLSGYIFRIGIPSDIRPSFGGKTGMRYSLKTGSLGEAKHRARAMAVYAQRTFKNIRNKGTMAIRTDL